MHNIASQAQTISTHSDENVLIQLNALEKQLREQLQFSDCQAQVEAYITPSQPMRVALQKCTELLVDTWQAAFARIWTLSEDGQILELQASAGLYTHIDGDHARVPVGKFKIGLIAQEQEPHLTNDVLNDPRVGNKVWAAQEGMVAFAGYPLMVEDKLLGVVALFAKHHLSESTLELLRRISQTIALGIQRHQSETKLRQQAEILQENIDRLQQTQLQLIHTEKMSSLGQMVAGIAHEINNPINFIHGNLSHVRDYGHDLIELLTLYQQEGTQPSSELQQLQTAIDLPFLLEDFPKTLESMKIGTDRIREIVLTMRNFSRLDEAEVKEVSLHEGINSTLLILHHRLKATDSRPEICVHQKFDDLPLVHCYASQINQVFMNILSNGIDALDLFCQQHYQQGNFSYRPEIIISTQYSSDETITINFQDNGPGIAEDVQSRLFDPFFTTKPVGEGTGLGLSISYQIITEKHKGQLYCNSTLEQGTTFTIELPI